MPSLPSRLWSLMGLRCGGVCVVSEACKRFAAISAACGLTAYLDRTPQCCVSDEMSESRLVSRGRHANQRCVEVDRARV